MENIFLTKTEQKKEKHFSKLKVTLFFLIPALITRVLTYFAAENSSYVEKLYSSTLYPIIEKSLGFISSLFPFSIAEFLLIIIVILFIATLFFIIFKTRFFLNNIQTIFHYMIRTLAIIYLLFYFFWGFNYYREDYSILTSMNVDLASYEELKELTLENIRKANRWRERLAEDENGLILVEETIDELGEITNLGFQNYWVGNIDLAINHGKVKPILLSKYMSYTGIVGIYIPFTSEANVNVDVPKQVLLSAISHEMAHQKGFAKEDEANFIAYSANINNPDERFKYSGYYLAMNQLMNELYRQNRDDYWILYDEISHAVKRDLQFTKEYWQARQGKVREKANKMNDTYLKANNQADGVKSYSGVVKLLLAEYKDRNEN